ncbi:transposase [Streptomyces sp. NBC_00654]|uniref:Tn3 family transposase n=1 Tax=Streptomyces sp. NBC_00654 TaxID=2975799 RepID=UPI00225126B9|nr:Tn3 family transposase [Streptomyces sp. NBC_00654]MCX4971279.1 transposase [Streptomyces sp. NBC_00654]
MRPFAWCPYAAMLEVGRAQKTIFVARYLRLRDLQREIEEGLNVMESSNGANSPARPCCGQASGSPSCDGSRRPAVI